MEKNLSLFKTYNIDKGKTNKSLQCLQEGPLQRKLAEPRMSHFCRQSSWHHFWPGLTVRLLTDTEPLTWLVYSGIDLFHLTVPPAVLLSGRQQGDTRLCPFRTLHGADANLDCVIVVDRGGFTVPAFPPLHPCQDLSSQQYSSSLAHKF